MEPSFVEPIDKSTYIADSTHPLEIRPTKTVIPNDEIAAGECKERETKTQYLLQPLISHSFKTVTQIEDCPVAETKTQFLLHPIEREKSTVIVTKFTEKSSIIPITQLYVYTQTDYTTETIVSSRYWTSYTTETLSKFITQTLTSYFSETKYSTSWETETVRPTKSDPDEYYYYTYTET